MKASAVPGCAVAAGRGELVASGARSVGVARAGVAAGAVEGDGAAVRVGVGGTLFVGDAVCVRVGDGVNVLVGNAVCV